MDTKETKQKSVLIIDDDPQLRDMLVEVLTKKNIRVITAKDAIEGFDMLQSEKPTLAIVDIMMPGPSGIDLINQVKKFPDIRDTFFIVLSNSTKATDVAEAISKNVTIFLEKDIVDPAMVCKIVEENLAML